MPAKPGTTVLTDPHRAEQILINLLSNAIKYSDSGGVIEIACARGEDGDSPMFARVSVRDTGPGIPEDRIDAIWEPFVQLGRELNQPAEGVGLGLAISRDLARQLGGELEVASVVGEGSTFTLSLPLVRTERSASPAEGTASAGSSPGIGAIIRGR
jgi:signal transduction histidine kinase